MPAMCPLAASMKRVLRACQLRDPPGRAPGHDVVLLGAHRVNGLVNAAQVDRLPEQRDLPRRDQVVLEIRVAE